MTTPVATRRSGEIDWRAAVKAGIAYTAGVFVFAFAAGAIRVTVVAPHLGALLAVVLEAPIVLAVSWGFSAWCSRRFQLSADSLTRVLMGAVAFSVLVGLEAGVSVWAFGKSLERYVANYGTAAGVVGLMMQLCFAAIPWVQSELNSGVGRS